MGYTGKGAYALLLSLRTRERFGQTASDIFTVKASAGKRRGCIFKPSNEGLPWLLLSRFVNYHALIPSDASIT